MKRLMVLTVLGLLLGCQTTGDGDESVDLTQIRADRINGHFEQGETAQAVTTAIDGWNDGLFSDNQLTRWLLDARGAMLDEYRQAIVAKDFPTALRASGNIHILSDEPWGAYLPALEESVQSDEELGLAWAVHLLDHGEPVPALSVLTQRGALDDVSSELLFDFLDAARSTNNFAAFRAIAEALRVRGSEEEFPMTGGTPADMLGGTVTVWVNRGIRIDNGVGVPDRSIGSGFFVDPRGYIVTNYHVVESEVDPEYEGYSRLFVKLPGNPDDRVPARVVGYDRIFDIALIKVELDPSYVFSFSDTRELVPGERVFALGSPGGLDSTITSGIVSASGRRFLQIGDAMQVDVPINPGNSGGPLVLPDGQVAGVVFAGIEQFEGVNFAVPAYWIRAILPNLFLEDSVVHSWLGTAVREVDDGLEVIYVVPEGGAERAGVVTGDVIRSIDGVAVAKLAEAQDVVVRRRSGELVPVEVVRGDDLVRLLVDTSDRPFSPVEELLREQRIDRLFPVLFGMEVDEVREAPWGADYVISAVYPGSIADESSLSVADPFALRRWQVDRELRAAFIEIIIKKRKAGFLEAGVQLGAYLESDRFL